MRSSGVSLGHQVASVIAGSIAPIIAVSLLTTFESSVPVASYFVTALVVLTLEETRGLSLHDIDAADAAESADRAARADLAGASRC